MIKLGRIGIGELGSVLTIDTNQITLLAKIGNVCESFASNYRPVHFTLSWFASARLSQVGRRDLIYRVSEPNSPSLTRVQIFIFGRTAVIVRMIFPRSFMVML